MTERPNNNNNLLSGCLPYLVRLTKVSSRALSLIKRPLWVPCLRGECKSFSYYFITSAVLRVDHKIYSVVSNEYNKLVNIIYRKQIHREQTGGYQWEGRRGNREWGSGGHKLLGVRWVQGCAEQHGKSSQYFVIAVNGKQLRG